MKTLEQLQLELIELLEEEGEFRGTLEEFMKRLDVREEMIIPLLKSLHASGDIIYEIAGEELIVKPSTSLIMPPRLTKEQEKEIAKLQQEGYKVIACSVLGGLQSRILRELVNRRVFVYFRNGLRVEGRVKGFDRFTIRLNSYMGKMLIYKHAISTIVYK